MFNILFQFVHPNPSIQGGEVTCTPGFQLIGLFVFYALTNGPQWINQWPLMNYTNVSSVDLNDIVHDLGVCTKIFEGQAVIVPKWCCWYGVYCCLSSAPCPTGYLDQTICGGCFVGSVTGIDLSYNNVRFQHYSPYSHWLPSPSCHPDGIC